MVSVKHEVPNLTMDETTQMSTCSGFPVQSDPTDVRYDASLLIYSVKPTTVIQVMTQRRERKAPRTEPDLRVLSNRRNEIAVFLARGVPNLQLDLHTRPSLLPFLVTEFISRRQTQLVLCGFHSLDR